MLRGRCARPGLVAAAQRRNRRRLRAGGRDWKADMEQNFWSDNVVPGAEFRKSLPQEYATLKSVFTDLGLARQ
jgi:tripartite-type tricarboxylate transporter receptor subunit TctC